jgi:peptide deformylase
MLEILKYPNKNLTETAKKVDVIDDEIRSKINQMKETLMEIDNAVGLASNQVGIEESIIVYYRNSDMKNYDKTDICTVINPRIEIVEPKFQISIEGCLSIPKVILPVRRYRTVKIVGLDENGEQISETVSGESSNIVQHEVDHINGRLIIDSLSKLKRKIYKKRLKGVTANAGN